ncbi:MAG: hypothetical protein H7834_02810 [Magnetococcus sp. YQC-9]
MTVAILILGFQTTTIMGCVVFLKAASKMRASFPKDGNEAREGGARRIFRKHREKFFF